jgi:hypothetical protein
MSDKVTYIFIATDLEYGYPCFDGIMEGPANLDVGDLKMEFKQWVQDLHPGIKRYRVYGHAALEVVKANNIPHTTALFPDEDKTAMITGLVKRFQQWLVDNYDFKFLPYHEIDTTWV